MEQVRTGQVHKEQICTAQTHMEQSVTYLVRRMTEGDSQAFDQLMGYYYPKVLRMAYLISMQTARILCRKPLCCAG